MVHQYKNNGYNIVLDVNSGSVHVVDDIIYDMIPLYKDFSKDDIAAKLGDTYSADAIAEAYDEIAALELINDIRTNNAFIDITHQKFFLTNELVTWI